jgi:hypothetical protein
MNERIKQLAEQAGISLSQKDFSYYWVESAEDIEKFAELIVKECTDELRQEWYDLNNTESELLGDARAVAILVGQKNGLLKAISRVKKHFGVVE